MDLNRDGRDDILSGSWPGEIYWFARQADGSFAAGEQLCGEDDKPLNMGHASSVFAVDWNADGALDLLVGTLTGDVSVLPGLNSQERLAFGPAQPITADGKPVSLSGGEAAPAAADWDADGRLDLIVGSAQGSVVWFRNAGSANEPKLEAARDLVGESPMGWKSDSERRPGEWGLRVKPCIVDWNGDGRLDLLLGDRCGSFQAKPSQTADEQVEERQAEDLLPELRKKWAAAFAEFQQLTSRQAGSPNDAAATRLDEVRRRLSRLKDEIAKVQEIQNRYQPGYQAHGFVWLFLRK